MPLSAARRPVVEVPVNGNSREIAEVVMPFIDGELWESAG
jgi:hypothetical protein